MKRGLCIAIMFAMLFCIMAEANGSAFALSKPSKPSISQVISQAEGQASIYWTKVKCTGYQLQYDKDSSFSSDKKITIKSSSTLKKTITGLTKGARYFFRIRAYNQSGSSKSYSSWSSVSECTIHEHNYAIDVEIEPSCGVEGIENYSCRECGHSYSIILLAKEHNYKKTITKKATKKSTGKAQYKCIYCASSYSETIPKLGQTQGTETKMQTKAASSKNSSSQSSSVKPQKQQTSNKSTKKQVTKSETKGKAKVASSNTRPIGTKKQAAGDNAPIGNKINSSNKNEGENSYKRQGEELSPAEKARAAAVKWAINIANDNSFHYGESKWAHHNGCYYCGTNQKKGSIKRKKGASKDQCAKTYCCNPFVTAAYMHGAGAKEVNCAVASKRFGLAYDANKLVKNSKSWVKVEKPSDCEKLKPGDVLLTPTHAMLYAGGGKVVHAAHHDNGIKNDYWNDSIKHGELSNKQWSRTKKIYRYTGSGRF